MDSELTCLEIKKKYEDIFSRLLKAAEKSGRNPSDINIIPVSKTHASKVLECAYKTGIKVFGENYVQEMADKHEILNKKGFDDIQWHFIGHLQTNKVKYIAPFVNYIHSVDSYKLASEISKRAANLNRTINIMLQVNTSGEPNKSGCDPDYLIDLAAESLELSNINIEGLMTIGTFTDDEYIQRKEFSLLREILNDVNRQLDKNWSHLSMGMTGDFEVAIDEGATMIRVGTAIFGSRIYVQH